MARGERINFGGKCPPKAKSYLTQSAFAAAPVNCSPAHSCLACRIQAALNTASKSVDMSVITQVCVGNTVGSNTSKIGHFFPLPSAFLFAPRPAAFFCSNRLTRYSSSSLFISGWSLGNDQYQSSIYWPRRARASTLRPDFLLFPGKCPNTRDRICSMLSPSLLPAS